MFNSRLVDTTSDFTSSGVNHLGTQCASARSIVRRAYQFNVDANASKGSAVFNLPLDSTLTDELTGLAKFYERFGITDAKIAIQATSPLGTSSGCIQVAHVNDPENATVPTDADTSVQKFVRQEGSMAVRPRDTLDVRLKTIGNKFTLNSGQSRFSSFGNVIGVVRDIPAVGDSIRFVVTFTAVYDFERPSVIDSTTASQLTVDPVILSQLGSKVVIRLPKLFTTHDVNITFSDPIKIMYDMHYKGRPFASRTKLVHSLVARKLDITDYVLDFSDRINTPYSNIKLCIDSLLGCKVTYKL